MQFFLGGRQFLVAGLQLLVDGLHLLERRAEFLGRGIRVLARGTQQLFIDAQFLLERRNARIGRLAEVARLHRLHQLTLEGWHLLEHDQIAGRLILREIVRQDRRNGQVDRDEAAVGAHAQADALHDPVLFHRRVQRVRQILAQSFPGYCQDVVGARITGSGIQVQAGVPAQVQDVAVALDQRTGRFT